MLFYVVEPSYRRKRVLTRKEFAADFELSNGELNKEDKDLLAQHAEIRGKEKPQGSEWGLEKAFCTPLDLESALVRAIDEGLLTKQEAQTERLVFTHFKPRIDRFMSGHTPALATVAARLQQKRQQFTDLASSMSRFTGSQRVSISVYLVPVSKGLTLESSYSHEDEGSYDGIFVAGIDTGDFDNAYDVIMRNLFQAYISTRQKALDATVRSVRGLDRGILFRGLAYAYSPGMLDDSGLGRLIGRADAVLTSGLDLRDQYSASILYALALQPLLKQALCDKDQTLEIFLPKAADAWLALQSLQAVMKPGKSQYEYQQHDYRNDPRHTIFTFGVIDSEAVETMVKTSQHHLFAREHRANDYQEMLTKIAKTLMPSYF